MFILMHILTMAFIAVIFIVFVYWVFTGNFPTVYKYSKHVYKKEQEEKIYYDVYRPYSYKKVKEFPTITLNQFKDFYAINPNSWSFRDCRVYKDNNGSLSFTFTYEEWKKYVAFKKQVEKERDNQKKIKEQQKITKEQNETTRKILESVQKDIDSIRAEQQRNINDTVELIKGVKL